MSLKGLFHVEFDKTVTKTITRRDGLYGIAYFIYYIIAITLWGLLMFNTTLYEDAGQYFTDRYLFRFLFYLPFAVISILPIFIILRVRKQSIQSIGIKNTKILKSILIGVVASIPFSAANIFGAISEGKTINPNIMAVLWTFLYFFFCIAFAEEAAFRGFLQTRIQGLIRNKWLGIVTVGLLFAFMHIPFQMMNANMPLLQFIAYDWVHLLTTCVIHIYLVYLYTRDNNILAPTITHALMDFSYSVFIK